MILFNQVDEGKIQNRSPTIKYSEPKLLKDTFNKTFKVLA